jgi:hypothetical protein
MKPVIAGQPTKAGDAGKPVIRSKPVKSGQPVKAGQSRSKLIKVVERRSKLVYSDSVLLKIRILP